ncbi:MAG: GNAT family N-acetyltransferase [Sphingobacteriia bacterium]|nr:GNAT family N-acetyltransferase [Sphingobacteriia bacterium]
MENIVFSNKNISIALQNDAGSITTLLNSAYRGESSKQGWTTEAHLIAGEVRTDDQNVLDVMQQPNSVILKYKDDNDQIIGCVNLQKHGGRIYLGMFSVSPSLQGGGIGRQLLKAAEEYTLQMQCHSIYMTVISVRKELIDWYKRNGYADTGERKPFAEDDLTGKHLQSLEFMVLEKELAHN